MSTETLARQDVIRVALDDDVAVALRPLAAGSQVEVAGQRIALLTDIPKGHKIATRPITQGAGVRKFGWPFGKALRDIAIGEHVHTHNVATRLEGVEDYDFRPSLPRGAVASARTYQGYRRSDGRVGTRNEIWILCTVGCVTRTAERIARIANERFPGRVDGVHAFTHPFGCSQLGDDLSNARRVLAALAAHRTRRRPHRFRCESNQLTLLAELPAATRRVRGFSAQKVDDETEEGLAPSNNLSKSPNATNAKPARSHRS
jgi:altronate hydrolase